MFYKCNECEKNLTEFDINFTKNLKGSFNKKSCKCANCLAKTDYLSNIKKPDFFIYFFPYFSIFMLVWFYKKIVPILPIIGAGSDMLVISIILPSIVCYITYDIRSIMDFKKLKDESYDRACMRTTYDASTHSLVTSSSTESVGDDHITEKMWLFVTYPVWGIFVYLYRIIKYYREIDKNYTKEIILAYNKTIKETEKFILPNNIQNMFELKMKKYRELRQQIISKYEYLGEEQVQIQIKKLKLPTITIHSNQTVYRLLFNCGNISFVVNKLGAKKVIFNNYTIYSEDEKYIIDLFDLVNENIGNDYIDLYNTLIMKIYK